MFPNLTVWDAHIRITNICHSRIVKFGNHYKTNDLECDSTTTLYVFLNVHFQQNNIYNKYFYFSSINFSFSAMWLPILGHYIYIFLSGKYIFCCEYISHPKPYLYILFFVLLADRNLLKIIFAWVVFTYNQMVVTCKPVKNFNILFFYRDKCFVHPFVDSWVLKLLSPFLIDRIVKRPRQKRRNLLPYSYFQLFTFHHYLMEFHCPDLDNQNSWQLSDFFGFRFYRIFWLFRNDNLFMNLLSETFSHRYHWPLRNGCRQILCTYI